MKALLPWLLAGSAFAQLPPSGKLSDTDRPLFLAAIAELEQQRKSAPDPATLAYETARTWASAKQWPEAMNWLRRVVDLHAGLDPSRDTIFADLRGTREFEGLLAVARRSTPAVSNSRVAFELAEADLVPESVAYSPRSKHFYFGSMKKGKVIRCSSMGECAPFAEGLHTVLGLKVHEDDLWVLDNSESESALIRYSLSQDRIVHRYAIKAAGHRLNDLVIAPAGDIYVTDTSAGAVWHLAPGARDLVKLPGRFRSANGIALSLDARLLYVSTYPDGITVVDRNSGTSAALAHPANLCLLTIDGLYSYGSTLIAIQNGFMTPRVVRLVLTRDRRAVRYFEVLERRNPLFEGITTGVLAGGEFFYMANIQDEKERGFHPITILRLPMAR